jgi:hypothetical protein
MMGEKNYPLLQVFSHTTKSQNNQIIFNKPMFLPLQKHHIISVKIALRNEIGEKIKFHSRLNNTICELVFMKHLNNTLGENL